MAELRVGFRRTTCISTYTFQDPQAPAGAVKCAVARDSGAQGLKSLEEPCEAANCKQIWIPARHQNQVHHIVADQAAGIELSLECRPVNVDAQLDSHVMGGGCES